MNCREAEHRIFAERDGALDNTERTALAAHVDACASCRRVRDTLASAANVWRDSAHHVRVPDAELEWQKVRREIRGGAAAAPLRPRLRVAWLAVPLAAAAAVAVTFLVDPERTVDRESRPLVAQATIEASVENGSPVVFVDDKSGWVFVWATRDPKQI